MAEHADTPDGQLGSVDDHGEAAVESPEIAPDIEVPASPAGAVENADQEKRPDEPGEAALVKRPQFGVRLALALGIVMVLALGAVGGWLGYQAYQERQDNQQRELFLRVARQGALNLTTISYTQVDADVQRILDSATGAFYDDFKKRSQPFVEIVKQAQSKSVGTITEAGLESVDGDQAQALVAVHVTTSNVGAADQPPRAWRMRIDVQKVGEGAKVSNVAFVP